MQSSLLISCLAGLLWAASAWPAGGAVTPPSLSLEPTPGEGLELRLSGEELSRFRIEVSTDLRAWETLEIPPDDASPFLLPVTPDSPARFFRAVVRAEAAPESLEVVLESNRAVAVWVETGGEVIEATGSNGVLYRLTIPEGALLSRERITMTPIESIENLPFTGFLGGVELEPDGLRLMRAANLEMIPPVSFDPSAYSGFAYAGNGENAHLVPVTTTSESIVFDLMSFSGYCAAEGTNESLQSMLPPPRCTAEWALREIAGIYRQLAHRQLHVDPDAELTPEERAHSGW